MTKLHRLLYSLLLTFIVSLIWVILGKNMYNYKKFPKILGISIFPLIGWTLGLWILSMVYFLLLTYSTKTGVVIVSILLYLILILVAEYIGYHVFKVKNEATKNYPGLYPKIKFLDTIHAPLWMKILYLGMGPLIILLLAILFH